LQRPRRPTATNDVYVGLRFFRVTRTAFTVSSVLLFRRRPFPDDGNEESTNTAVTSYAQGSSPVTACTSGTLTYSSQSPAKFFGRPYPDRPPVTSFGPAPVVYPSISLTHGGGGVRFLLRSRRRVTTVTVVEVVRLEDCPTESGIAKDNGPRFAPKRLW